MTAEQVSRCNDPDCLEGIGLRRSGTGKLSEVEAIDCCVARAQIKCGAEDFRQTCCSSLSSSRLLVALTQVALIVRYGTVILYDDTAVKNKYRLPLGLMVVIDGNYNTRIVGQSLAVDTTVDTTETFVWMLKAVLKARGDKQPSVFIQGADAAMEEAVKEVFPGTIAKRCLFHLRENITEHCAGTLGADFQVRLSYMGWMGIVSGGGGGQHIVECCENRGLETFADDRVDF